ncbi:Response regulator receiver domain-containing protein [Sphingomonas sp. YR710]|uniref:response regulator n=1 Tax=Sphingomonas sp. YR710 TaxID=1882773 RepID=UPI00088A9EA1|nr:response regulator [Sphingomonas sp. YR710]SDD78877.1 Response regulator receiver domain-containing protein [Sphingomonas sp. YR710]
MNEKLRIVIVENDALISMDLADLLIGMGHDVTAIARTEAEAVAAAARCGPDLMIVDGQLDEGSGGSAMAKILRHGFVPHLYITGDPMRMLDMPGDAVVIGKPFTLNDLTQGIAKARLTRPFDASAAAVSPTGGSRPVSAAPPGSDRL